MPRFSMTQILIVSALSVGLFLPSCARKTDESTVIATVNGRPIYLKELKRELSNRVRQNPSLEVTADLVDDLVDTLIKKQLIIQEAMNKKMAETQKFVDTIKTFWEQTLIRDFIDYKSEEFDRYIFVSEKEIQDFYNNLKKRSPNIPPLEKMREKLDRTIRRRKKSQALEDWLADKKKKSQIYVNRQIILEAVK